MKTVRSTLAIALVLAVFAMAPQVTMAQETAPTEPEIAKLVATAKTAEDQRKIADYYQKQAAEARKKVTDLTALRDCYKKASQAGEFPKGRYECDLQSRQYRKIAEENERLAKMHLDMAEKLAKAEKK